jgi:hypothetical protein
MTNKRPLREKNVENKQKVTEIQRLQDIYRQYLVPMPLEDWSKVRNLSQPSRLKHVPTRTGYSFSDFD